MNASWVVTGGQARPVTDKELGLFSCLTGLEEMLGENSAPPSGGRVRTPGRGALILRSAMLTWHIPTKGNYTVAARGPATLPGRTSLVGGAAPQWTLPLRVST